MIRPASLRPGDVVGVAAPCYALEESAARVGAEALERLGLRVRFADNAFSTADVWAGTLEERVHDFNALIADPEVRMILFGGGEVGNELLPYLDYEGLSRDPKSVRGFSDGTTLLNAITSRSGLVTYYGPGLRMFSDPDEADLQDFREAHLEPTARVLRRSDWEVLRPGRAEGVLIGGYLVNFAVMLNGSYLRIDQGTRYLLFLEDHILFNPPCVVSKYLSHIEQSGLMSHVSGLIFGQYADEPYPDIERLLLRLGDRYRIPVVKNEDFGHKAHSVTIPIGLRAVLDTDAQSIECAEPFMADLSPLRRY